MKKNIAAPRPLKRSGVIATVRPKYPRSSDYSASSGASNLVDVELLSTRVDAEEALLNRSHGEDASQAVKSALLYHHQTTSMTSSADLDLEGSAELAGDESDLERHIELEGSCEIQRIFLSGFHTPAPRADDASSSASAMASTSALFFFDDYYGHHDTNEDAEDDGLGLLRATSRSGHRQQTAPSPSFQSFSFVPAAVSRHVVQRHADEDSCDVDGLGSDFPLLGQSPSPGQAQRPNSVDEEEFYDEDAYFPGRRHHPYFCPRAANPMPLNTPFHASVANDHPAAAMASYYGNSSLYDNSHHVVMSTRGHFYTLPASAAPGHRAAQMLKGAAALDSFYGDDNEEENAHHLHGGAAEASRATRNRSYSEPIPFVPTTPNRS